jgi:hypothetical protein
MLDAAEAVNNVSLLVLLHKSIRFTSLSLNRSNMLFTPGFNLHLEWQWCLQDTGVISIRIQWLFLASNRITWRGELECPEKFRGDAPHITLCQMDSRTNATTSSVVIMVYRYMLNEYPARIEKLQVRWHLLTSHRIV